MLGSFETDLNGVQVNVVQVRVRTEPGQS